MSEKNKGFTWTIFDADSPEAFQSAQQRHAELSQGHFSEDGLITKWLTLIGEFPIGVIQQLQDFLRDEKRGTK